MSNQYGLDRREKMPKWLKDKRCSKKLSQVDVANKVGITRVSYARIEIDERSPSVETAKKIANVLDFDWTRFYEDEETQHEAK